MNILVIGSGGREHSIVRCLSKSESCDKIFCTPGNPGIQQLAECVKLDIKTPSNVIEFCRQNDIPFVVVGPEQPLADGLSDALRSSGIHVFGPSRLAAQLETSKSFAKNFMQKYNIPTAKFRTFTKDEKDEAVQYVKTHSYPIVLKADGLAAGKGVIITNDVNEAVSVTESYLNGALGTASEKIVIGRGLSAMRAKNNCQSWLLYTLKHHFSKEDMIGVGCIFASTTKKELLSVELPSPPAKDIIAFNQVVAPMDAQIKALSIQNTILVATRDMLLPRLMKGEMV